MAVCTVFMVLGGCHTANKLADSVGYPAGPPITPFVLVACCSDDAGNFPSNVPQSHQDYCHRAELAGSKNELLDGKVTLAVHVDCWRDGRVGAEYYK